MPRHPRSAPTLLMVASLGVGCQDAPAPDVAAVPGTETTATQADGVVIEWLDDATRADGVTHHRIAARLTGPRSGGDGLRKVARDALADRARTLGFRRLDNLQIEASCADDVPDDSACTAKVVAIASR